ncbi:MAG TPA: acetolactate synthase small subunit [Terriglobales bacterium]|nr:acetolactate synthase small subunit [Terriglobales bacterium]
MIRTFVIYVSDHPGVLNRVSSLFRRRGYNIESLTVGHTEIPEVSRMTAVVAIDSEGALLVKANLYKLPEVMHVDDITSVPSVNRELAIVKVSAPPSLRGDLMRILEVFRARVLEVASESLLVETTGAEDAVDSLIEVLRPYGILEMTRTGRVAMTRGNKPAFALGMQKKQAAQVASVPEWNSSLESMTARNCS